MTKIYVGAPEPCTLFVFPSQPEKNNPEYFWMLLIFLEYNCCFLADKYSQFCSVTSCKEGDTFEAVRGLKYGGLQRRKKGLQSGLKQG